MWIKNKHLIHIPEITSKEMYAEALKLFNVEIRKSGRGHIVVVADDIGNAIRLSNFKDGPRFYVVLQKGSERQENKLMFDKFQIVRWVRDLNRLEDICHTHNSKSNGKTKGKEKNYQY